jgi:hypothetical protein
VAKHEDKSDRDGSGTYDPSKTKDVWESGGGKHAEDDIEDVPEPGTEDEQDS